MSFTQGPPHFQPLDWQQCHRETMQCVDDWLDAGSGECWLRDYFPRLRDCQR
jgi:hypothetical protein